MNNDPAHPRESGDPGVLLTQTGLTAWAIANIAGATAFLHFASWSWLEPNLRGEDAARAGDSIIWSLTAFPVVVTSGVLNLIWLALVARERRRRKAPYPAPFIVIIASTWTAAIIIDRLRFSGF